MELISMTHIKRGQMRIIEALVTCLILFTCLTASVFFSNVYKAKEITELKETGLNIIDTLDDTEVIEKIVLKEEGWEAELKSLIESLLPPDVFYNLTIYSSLDGEGIAEVSNILDQGNLTNSDFSSFQQVVTISLPLTRSETRKLDVMLVIDRSGSMGYEDPPRIYYAKEAAKTFIDQLNASRDMVGLVSFGWEGTLDHSLSNDFESVKSEIDSLEAYGATNMGEGIERSNEEFSLNSRNDTILAMILLSDGMANVDRDGNYYDEGEDRTPAINYVIEEANEAGNMSVVIYTIGLGNETHFDEELLRSIVRNGGHYYHAPSAEELTEIYLMIAQDLLFEVNYDIVTIQLVLIKAR